MQGLSPEIGPRLPTETQRLEAYRKALDNLSPDEQLKKITAVKSEVTLRRFVGESSPDGLVARFAYLANNVVTGGLTNFEQGRISFHRHEVQKSEVQLSEAYFEDHTDKALPYLGIVRGIRGKETEDVDTIYRGIFFMEKAIENDVDTTGMLNVLMQTQMRFDANVALTYLPRLREKDPYLHDFYLNELAGDNDDTEETCRKLMSAFEAGSVESGKLLYLLYLRSGEVEQMIPVIIKLIKHGDIGMYANLGKAYEMQGQLDFAADAYKKGLALKVPLSSFLINVYVKQNKIEEALKVLESDLRQGKKGHLPLIVRDAFLQDRHDMVLLILNTYLNVTGETDKELAEHVSSQKIYQQIADELLKQGVDLHYILLGLIYGKGCISRYGKN